jgi:hypothetical protein
MGVRKSTEQITSFFMASNFMFSCHFWEWKLGRWALVLSSIFLFEESIELPKTRVEETSWKWKFFFRHFLLHIPDAGPAAQAHGPEVEQSDGGIVPMPGQSMQ